MSKIKKVLLGILLGGLWSGAISTQSIFAQGTRDTDTTVDIQEGNLEFIRVLDSLSFTLNLSSAEPTDGAFTSSQNLDESNIITISDYRALNESGWLLNAELSNFGPTENPTLIGSSLNFTGGNATDTANSALNIANLSLDSGATDATDATAVLNLLERTAREGYGITDIAFSNVELSIPEGAIEPGKHTATITWTLSVGPNN